MSRIPDSFLDDLRERVDIVEIIDHRVKLRKTGKNFSACCPFHDEKTPSFTVSPDKQFFHCFGCGASGDALGFLIDYERLEFLEAVEQLARIAGLEVPREERSEAANKQERIRKSIYKLLDLAGTFFQLQLKQHPNRDNAIKYLKNRGLDGHIAKDYGIGYAPPGWDNLLKALGEKPEDKESLISGGMLVHQPESNKLYDRFRHRIIFPIHDSRGRVIGFGGRVLGDDKPKYLNSPETPVFHKGRELYGLYEARQNYKTLPRLLVVEGYMDVVSLAQFGIRYGVATLGTACGEDHLTLAFRHTNEVVFCFDGDNAGRAAATRALESAIPVMQDGRTVKFLFLPDGEDPDTLVRQVGTDKFTLLIENAVPLEDYLFDAAAEGVNIRTMEGRASLSKRSVPLLHKLPQGVFKELMFDSLAQRTGLQRSTLEELVQTPEALPSQVQAPVNRPKKEENQQKTAQNKPEPPQEEAQYPESAAYENDRPPADFDEYFQQDHAPHDYEEMAQAQPEQLSAKPATANRGRYLLPLQHKAMALLLAHTELASLEPDHDFWLNQNSLEFRQIGRMLKLLHERPHYQLSHIIGHWRANYGSNDTEQLAHIAGHELLHAAGTFNRADDEDTHYDTNTAFQDCLKKLRQKIELEQSNQALHQLKNRDLSSLSCEDRAKLVQQVLTNKQKRQ